MRMQPNVHSASRWQMSQFVFKQIAHDAIQQRQVSIHNHVLFEITRHFVMALGHGRLVNINQLSHDIGEVDWAAIHVKRTRLRFGKVQRGVQQLQEPIQVFDRFPNRVTPLSFPSLHNADSSVPRIKVTGLFRSCATRASNSAKLIHRRLKPVQHVIKSLSQSRDFI